MAENECLGCGIKIEKGEICYKCLYNGLTITQIHLETGKNSLIGCDGKVYKIWED